MRFAIEKIRVTLPDSQVKCPGFLLKDKKPPIDITSKRQKIQGLLAQFLTLEDNTFQSFSDLSAIPIERPATFTAKKKSKLNWSLSSRPDDDVKGPGRLKSMSEGTSSYIHKAKEIFQVFNMQLIIHQTNNSKGVQNLLEALVPEICFFPYNFYEGLNIKNMIIAKQSEDMVCSQNETCFFLDEHDTSEKILQRLHKIIFRHLMISHRDLLKKWQEYNPEDKDSSVDTLEGIFMALMSSSIDKNLKSKLKKLREFLETIYPEAMSESKFKQKAKQKRRTLRVQFDDSVSPDSSPSCNSYP